MSAPVADYIRYPGGANYSGKSVKGSERLIGANATFTQLGLPISSSKIDGLYSFSVAAQAVQASAHNGTSTGWFWLQNPVGSTKTLRVRKLFVTISNNVGGAIDHDSAPRIGFATATFTGTFAGATATPAKRKTSDATNTGDARTAVTGATVSLVATAWCALVPGLDFTTDNVAGVDLSQVWAPKKEDDFVILAAGECLVCYQLDNGTASDQRVVTLGGVWEERDAS